MIPIPDPGRLLGGLWRRGPSPPSQSFAGSLLGLAAWAAAVLAAIIVGGGSGFWWGVLAFFIALMVFVGLLEAVPLLGGLALGAVWSGVLLLMTGGLNSPMPWEPVHVLGTIAIVVVFVLIGWSEQKNR